MGCRSTARAAVGSGANQLRVFLTAAAYVLMQELRLRAARTACARSQVTWLRDRLLKLGVHVIRSVRRLVLQLPRSTPQLIGVEFSREARNVAAFEVERA